MSNHYRLADIERMTRRGGPRASKGSGAPRRENVRRLARDGAMKPRGRSSDDTVNAIGAFRQGIASAREGVPRYTNPYIEQRARMWTRGWNAQHVVGKRASTCRGCEICLVGTALTPKADRDIYNRLVATNGEAC